MKFDVITEYLKNMATAESYTKLGFAALLPVVFAALFFALEKWTLFKKAPYVLKQIIIGIIFGGIAIFGTEYGIPMNGAMINCRDAAVLTGGLLFGAPAGIIAGVLGGVERWIAVAWGVGSFTRVACSVSTVIAGIYAALLRKFLFDNKKPGTLISLAIGVVMEVFHLTMVFITNIKTPIEAMAVVKSCTVPMLAANGLSVMLATIVVTLMANENLGLKFKTENVRISQTVQRRLLITVLLAFLVTSGFVYILQTKLAQSQTDTLLSIAIKETTQDINDASDSNMLSIARKVKYEVENTHDLKSIAKKYNISEISLINEKGIIYESTEYAFLNFDMSSGEQSKEFLCLLSDKEEFVQSYGPITSDPNIKRKYAGVKYGNGFIQVGYNSDAFHSDIASQVKGITKNRHVGKTGIVFILDENKNIVSAPGDFTQEKMLKETAGVEMPKQNITFEVTVNGKKSYSRYAMSEGYYIVAAQPISEANETRNIAVYVNSFMEILVFAILFLLIYQIIKAVVVNKIKKFNESLEKISAGNLDVVMDVRSNEEFASLSDDINTTVNTLKSYISDAKKKIEEELELAKNIQASALPSAFPAFPNRKEFDIYASMNPAKEVGGDFYDFYLTSQPWLGDKLNFLVADVSGKGIPAAMFMMRAKTELKTLTEAGMELDSVFTSGNNALCEGNDAGMFVTAWQGNIDLSTGVLQFANAGHNPPLIRRKDGKFEYLRTGAGFVLAGMEGVKYKSKELQLESGDCVFLYTDGVTEAQNSANELYGEERLLEAINAKEFTDMQELCKYVKADVDKFVGNAPQFDDITMVALHYIGEPPVPTVHFDECSIDDIPVVTEKIESELEKIDCPMKTVVQINIAIDEIYSNIVKHGYKGKGGPVTVKLIERQNPHRVFIRFEDEAIPYNPLTKEDPDVTLSAEERNIGGLGIYMVKKSMDDMKYKYESGKNILSIMKLL